MNTISGKSSSLIRPSPLSSSRLTTIGVIETSDESGNGAPTAFFADCPVPPHWISFVGRTFLKSTGGSVHVGAFPVPVQRPASHAVNGGQSQSSSQVQ